MFKELFTESSKQERLDAKAKDPFICTDQLQALFKNKVEFTIEMSNGQVMQFEQLGSRKWRGKVIGKHRMLDYSDGTPRTANEHLAHLADIGFITGSCKVIKVDGKKI